MIILNENNISASIVLSLSDVSFHIGLQQYNINQVTHYISVPLDSLS